MKRAALAMLAILFLAGPWLAATAQPTPTFDTFVNKVAPADLVPGADRFGPTQPSPPKGQIYLVSRTEPVWFSSVRDTIAFLRLPEEARDVAVIYVNDMGKAKHWDKPEPGAWVDAHAAWFIIDSDMRGGMGAPEAVPFSERSAAKAFRDKHGGEIIRLDDIPDAYVLGPVDLSPAASEKGEAPSGGGPSHSGHPVQSENPDRADHSKPANH